MDTYGHHAIEIAQLNYPFAWYCKDTESKTNDPSAPPKMGDLIV